jgi:hypothetical protein
MSQKLLTLHEQIVPSSFQINERFRLKKQVCNMENTSEQQNKQQLKYHTVRTVPKSNIKIPHCQNSS